jgi:hypothetical protein
VNAHLRGHHLICLQFYRGQGYSDAFVANLERVLQATADVPALVVSGPDDVCAACPGLGADSTCQHPDTGEAEALRIDALALQLLDAAIGEALSLSQARTRLAADAAACGRWRAESCASCPWESACGDGWNALLRGYPSAHASISASCHKP